VLSLRIHTITTFLFIGEALSLPLKEPDYNLQLEDTTQGVHETTYELHGTGANAQTCQFTTPTLFISDDYDDNDSCLFVLET
jgi:hypothetical protein